MGRKKKSDTALAPRPAADLAGLSEDQKQALAKLDELVPGAGFSDVITLGNKMQAIRKYLAESGVLNKIMALQGSVLGFRTDRDNPKPGQPDKYPVEVVADCVIEATLAGVQPTGNQFNIISSRSYITKEGFKHKLDNLEDLTNLEFSAKIESMQESKATVRGAIKYIFNGKPGNIERVFICRLNQRSTEDAVLGKFERKIYKALFEKLTNQTIPDGDVDDSPLEAGGPVIDAQAEAKTQTEKVKDRLKKQSTSAPASKPEPAKNGASPASEKQVHEIMELLRQHGADADIIGKIISSYGGEKGAQNFTDYTRDHATLLIRRLKDSAWVDAYIRRPMAAKGQETAPGQPGKPQEATKNDLEAQTMADVLEAQDEPEYFSPINE